MKSQKSSGSYSTRQSALLASLFAAASSFSSSSSERFLLLWFDSDPDSDGEQEDEDEDEEDEQTEDDSDESRHEVTESLHSLVVVVMAEVAMKEVNKETEDKPVVVSGTISVGG